MKKIIKKIKIEKLYGESKITHILSKNIDLYQLEDGLGNYKINRLNKILDFLFFNIIVFPEYGALDKRIKKVYLTGLAPIPNEIVHKVEIFDLLDVKFKKAVTLFSTAALGLEKEVEINFYGTEVHSKVFARFGSCNNIMKRNVFLDENIE